MASTVLRVLQQVFIVVTLIQICAAEEVTQETIVDAEINKLGTADDNDDGFYSVRETLDRIVRFATGSGAADAGSHHFNDSMYGNNGLWKGLFKQCGKTTALSCVKQNIYNYLDDTVSSMGDIPIIDGLTFTRNEQHVFENKYDRSLNEMVGSDGQARSAISTVSTFESITDLLYDKGMTFISSHDLRLSLPDTLFDGAVVTFSPRALDQNGGALLKLEVKGNSQQEEGRIFHKKRKQLRKKLLLTFFALLLIIKLIKVKLMFFLPVIFGVGTAKKLLLKVLLFLFPALSHLFKFCSYYHGLHTSKFHHHHHQIAHHHHHVPVHVPVPVHVHHPPQDHHVDDVAFHTTGPSYGGPPWLEGGPGHDYNRRNAFLAAAQHNEKELASWGLGGGTKDTFGIADNSLQAHSLAYSGYSYLDDQRVSRSAHAVTEPTRTLVTPAPHRMTPAQNALQMALRLKLLTPKPPLQGTTIRVTYDPVYSPMLQKMDNVFVQLGFNEEACRERLVCSMYKNPTRFSPHSNLISAELSRDPDELHKPAVTNSAVSRFQRYVQAARDGQDQRDCLRLYPACTVNTEV